MDTKKRINIKQGIINLRPDQLITHPRNMRKFYPADQVQEMADSIRAHSGVIEPLIITKGSAGKYLVVDGNMRLAGARLLADDCPPLECKIVSMTEASQLLAMVTTNQVRYDVDPVSEALHYKALRDKEGLTIREISKRTGVYEARIINRIILAELEEPIQQLIADKKLPSNHLVAQALLKLEADMRMHLVKKIAANPGTSIKTIIKACENLAAGKAAKKLKRPAVQTAGVEDKQGRIRAKELRLAFTKVCRSCNQLEDELGQGLAWPVVAHAADETCSRCDLKEMRTICESCPAVELLRNLKGGNRD